MEKAFKILFVKMKLGLPKNNQPQGLNNSTNDAGSSKDAKVKKNRCNYYKKPSHYIAECQKRIANEKKRQGSSNSNFVIHTENSASSSHAHFAQDDKDFVFAATLSKKQRSPG